MNKTTVYSKSSKDKIKQWSIRVDQFSDGSADIVAEHGYMGGKIQTNTRHITKGKNIGKSNETTPFEQACSDAAGLLEKKKDQGYVGDIADIKDEPDGLFLPMLAHKYDKYSHKINFPCWVQPKLDGIRMLARKENGEITMWSRQGKIIDVPDKIAEELKALLKERQCVDGELYVHDWTFQRIISAVKKRREDTDLLKYHIYDCPSKELSFEDRFYNNSIYSNYTHRTMTVSTYKCHSQQELAEHEANFLSEGYEGLIVRNANSFYKFKHRSYDLQKVKRFVDDEFEIISGKDGVGREEGLCVFRCKTKDGLEFDARPKGTAAYRRDLFDNLDSYIGKMLTVKYQELTDDGIPRFPVGISIRDYE